MEQYKIIINWIRTGQIKPYADSVYEAELIFPLSHGKEPSEKMVKECVGFLVHPFEENTGDKMEDYFRPHLELKRTSEGHWHAKVTRVYTD